MKTKFKDLIRWKPLNGKIFISIGSMALVALLTVFLMIIRFTIPFEIDDAGNKAYIKEKVHGIIESTKEIFPISMD